MKQITYGFLLCRCLFSLYTLVQIVAASHDRADEVLFLMIVLPVAHGDLLFLDPPPQLAVCVVNVCAVHGPSAALEDTPHLMEQTVHCQDRGGQRGTVPLL